MVLSPQSPVSLEKPLSVPLLDSDSEEIATIFP